MQEQREKPTTESIFAKIAGNGRSYAIRLCQRGTWQTLEAQVLGFDGKFVQLLTSFGDELIVSITCIDGAKRLV
jgi:hypothetical protein